jgi:hypothetical protein
MRPLLKSPERKVTCISEVGLPTARSWKTTMLTALYSNRQLIVPGTRERMTLACS